MPSGSDPVREGRGIIDQIRDEVAEERPESPRPIYRTATSYHDLAMPSPSRPKKDVSPKKKKNYLGAVVSLKHDIKTKDGLIKKGFKSKVIGMYGKGVIIEKDHTPIPFNSINIEKLGKEDPLEFASFGVGTTASGTSWDTSSVEQSYTTNTLHHFRCHLAMGVRDMTFDERNGILLDNATNVGLLDRDFMSNSIPAGPLDRAYRNSDFERAIEESENLARIRRHEQQQHWARLADSLHTDTDDIL